MMRGNGPPSAAAKAGVATRVIIPRMVGAAAVALAVALFQSIYPKLIYTYRNRTDTPFRSGIEPWDFIDSTYRSVPCGDEAEQRSAAKRKRKRRKGNPATIECQHKFRRGRLRAHVDRDPGAYALLLPVCCFLCSCLQHGPENSGVDAELGADRPERMIGQHARGRLGVHQDRNGDLVAVHQGRGGVAGSRVDTRGRRRAPEQGAEEGAEEGAEQEQRHGSSGRTVTAAAAAAAAAPQPHCRPIRSCSTNERSRQTRGSLIWRGWRFGGSQSHSQPPRMSISCSHLDARSHLVRPFPSSCWA